LLLRPAQFKESVLDLSKSIALAPGEVDTISQRGHVFFKWQDFKQALEDFVSVTSLAPQEAEAWFMRGQTLNQLGLCPEAIDAYNCTLQLQPKVWRAVDWLVCLSVVHVLPRVFP
jgi:tetratricopeptide (TPR) repeat protein